MTDKKPTNEELNALILEMTSRLEKMADIVDAAIPDNKETGSGVRKYANKLKDYVQALTAPDEMDVVLEDLPQEKQPTTTLEDLNALALKNCIETFELIEANRVEYQASQSPNCLDVIKVLSPHALGLYELLRY